jgi:hypothetical protein
MSRSPPAFQVEAVAEGEGTRFAVTEIGAGETRHYHVRGGEQQDYIAFYTELGRDFGTRVPHRFDVPVTDTGSDRSWQPLLTKNAGPRILSGYGDPAMLKTEDGYYLVATSNDAPDACPTLFQSSIRPILKAGSISASSSPKARRPAGPRKAATSPISGRPKWRRWATNIGSPTPPAKRATPSPSGWQRARARPAPGPTLAIRC